MNAMKKLVIFIALIAPGISQDCTLGSSLSASAPSGRIGHFLDLDQPATCSGTLVAWNFCFYPESVPVGEVEATFRIWRPLNGNRHRFVTGHVYNFPSGILSTGGTGTVCSTLTVSTNFQFRIQEGDVYAVSLSSDSNSLPILASLPASSGRRLYVDTRIEANQQNIFRLSDLNAVGNVGMHLSADIRLDPVTSTSTPATVSTTAFSTTPATTTTPASPVTTAAPKSTTESVPTIDESTTSESNLLILLGGELSAQNTDQNSTTPNDPGQGRGGSGAAVAVTIILFIVISILVACALLLVFYWRKNRLNCLKGKKRLLAIDNALYRVGSQHIAPLFSKSPSHRKRSDSYEYAASVPKQQQQQQQQQLQLPQNRDQTITSNHSYDFPREIADSNNYSIPTSIPIDGPDSHDYSIPSNIPANHINHTIETHVTIEPDPSSSQLSSPRQFSDYKQPRNSGGGGGGIEARERVIDLEQAVTESGDYIYMSSCTDGAEMRDDGEDKSASFDVDEEEYIGPEEYQARIVYDSVQYRTLLRQATASTCEEESPYKVPPKREDEIYMFISQQKIKVIPRHCIIVTEVIGSGHFGEVDKGLWKSVKQNTTLEVALKSLPSSGGSEDKVKLLQEAVIMGQFSHPNVIHLYGIISQGDPLVLVIEYMDNRDLKKYLHKLRPQQCNTIDDNIPNLLLNFSEQVALGMHYLASKRLVHRDLAARNILVSKDNICKIADFGMARDISDNGFYVGNDGKVPLKWTAPEAISLKKYSIASDVWSYGCLLYEIWSFGVKPFRGMKNDEAIIKVNSGYRLPPPPGCPKVIYTLMIQSWHPVSTSRPKYQAILTSLLVEPKKVLHIPQEDASSHSLACILGSTLEAGVKMYPDIQITYVPNATAQRDPDYEYMNNDTDSDN